jgi:thioredoxin reductase (NADPH)
MTIKKIVCVGVLLSVVAGGTVYWLFFIHTQRTFALKHLEHTTQLVPLAIIGSGPAGLSAALYGTRLGVYSVVFAGGVPGGQLTETGLVENWPGVGREQGPVIMQHMRDYVVSLGAPIVPESIARLDCSSWPYQLVTDDGQIRYALSIVVATGAAPRVLDVPGERDYWGKGVTTCALCDAPYYKNKDVIVVGGGDSAFEQALQLAPHARTVAILVRKDRVRASTAMQNQVRALPNVRVLVNKEVKRIVGDGSHVTRVMVFDHAQQTESAYDTAGVFLAIGHEPRTAWLNSNLALHADGSVVVQGRGQETSVPGIFAAGDVADMTYRQAGVAAGDGIKAAIQAVQFLQHIGWNAVQAQRYTTQYYRGVVSDRSNIRLLKSVADFEREVLKASRPVMIDFYAHHCPACMHMLPLYEAIAQQYNGQMLFCKVDTQAVPALEERLKVERIPCFVFFNKGQPIARSYAIMNKVDMSALVQRVIASVAN